MMFDAVGDLFRCALDLEQSKCVYVSKIVEFYIP